jgi:hypothetical protein
VFSELCFKDVKETDNGSSVEPTCSGHCVPIADRIEVIFLCRSKNDSTILFQHILSVQKNSYSYYYSQLVGKPSFGSLAV